MNPVPMTSRRIFCFLCRWCVGVASLSAATWLGAAPAAPFFERTDLFEVPQEGYLSYRIPCIVVSRNGTVLAFTSARRAVSDWADIDLMLRRSLDGGKTWQPRRIVAQDGKATIDNPTAIVDEQTGAIHFLYQKNYAQVFYMRSDDEGATFTPPVDITAAVAGYRSQYHWDVVAPGPGHGLQMKNGRLVVPIWLSNGGKLHRPSVAGVITSDDHGKTWNPGELVPPYLICASETAAVQLEDGRVALFIRNEEPAYRHAVSYSRDGATGWSTPVLHKDLYSPISFATAVRLSGAGDGKKSRLLFVHPNNPEKKEVIRWSGMRPRNNVTVRLSTDEGVSWPVSKVLEPGRSAYADLAVGRDGMIFCLVERGEIDGNNLNTRYLSVLRFNLEWLTDGRDTLAP